MSEPFVFDPRWEGCKSPYGAVPTGRTVTLHIRPLAAEGFTHCTLIQLREFDRSSFETSMPFSGMDGDRARFSLTFSAPAEPELVWYCFRLRREDGSGCFLDKTGYRCGGTPRFWQLTVYDDTLPTPGWFGEGVVYQIFPDRFCRLSVPSPEGLVGNRWVHQDWSDAPQWQPDEDGEIRNRDFFGGSLAGIASKLDDLTELGVTVLYLCPIFEAASNHRYDTADYRKIDPMLGTEEDFKSLCREAHARGIRVVLDGVFNHTGSRSVYFNADGFYPTVGAAQSESSPWYKWYRFRRWPDNYESWWGVKTLPAVEESEPSYVDYIIDAPDSVVRRWLDAGADGWRLDVADELPDRFIEKLRSAMEETKPGALLLGEVWEDGSNKVSYSKRRRYLLGREVHGLMNYPFRTAALHFLLDGDAAGFVEAMETLRENYPRPAFYSAMNFLGTHDTARILTLLGARTTPEEKGARAACRLDREERALAVSRLKLAALLLFTFPGAPMIYYGDEAGMEGFEDPLNRGTYPWGREDAAIRSLYAGLGRLRRDHPALRRGEFRWLRGNDALLAFSRTVENETLSVVLNAGDRPASITLPTEKETCRDLLSGGTFLPREGRLDLTVPPMTGCLLDT